MATTEAMIAVMVFEGTGPAVMPEHRLRRFFSVFPIPAAGCAVAWDDVDRFDRGLTAVARHELHDRMSGGIAVHPVVLAVNAQ